MHNVHHSTYPENVDKSKVQKYWDNYAAREDWEEGCCGLNGDIRWIDHVCADEEEAEKYIEEHDRGWYDQLAVKFKRLPQEDMTSATHTRLKKQIESYYEKIKDYDEKHSISTLKAEFITCPKCSSKLAKAVLVEKRHGHRCPVCGNQDIRAAYIGEQIKSYQDKIKEWQKQLKEEEKKIAIKLDKKTEIRWLVKIEYHT